MTVLNLGGFGIPYNPAEMTFQVSAFADALREVLSGLRHRVKVCIESGQASAGLPRSCLQGRNSRAHDGV
jgi:diaminopimelate decarboxylase